LKVVLISPPWYPVPPEGYGGIELVVGLLAKELARRGHEVAVLGAQGSPIPGAVALAPSEYQRHLGREEERWFDLAYSHAVLEWIREHGAGAVIHDHSGGIVATALDSLLWELPTLHTVHGPVGEGESEFYSKLGRATRLVAISRSQMALAPRLRWAGWVHNAVDVEALPPPERASPDRYLLTLARISPQKGQHLAIEVAKTTGMRLVLAGKVETTPEGRAYFEERVLPHLDGDQVRHLPNVYGQEKAGLLARAWAMLLPLRWEEPFGLAMAEAMACGTPVVALDRGSARELVRDGETGFVGQNVAELVDKTLRCGELDRAAIAAWARQQFSPARMAAEYEALYRQVAAGRLRSATEPRGHPLEDLGLYPDELRAAQLSAVTAPVRPKVQAAATDWNSLHTKVRAPGGELWMDVEAPPGEVRVQPE
jgi:glycosyltransferase involved in cell wall biosynthesis